MEQTLSSLGHLPAADLDLLVTKLRAEKVLTGEEEEEVRQEMHPARPLALRKALLRKGAPAIQVVRKFLEENPGAHPSEEEPGALRETHEESLRSARVPPLPRCFVPRPGPVARVRAALLAASGGGAAIVWGPGGCGKTTLLSEALRSAAVLDAFGRIAWLHVGEAPLQEKLQELYCALGGSRRPELEAFPEVLDELCAELSRQKKQRPPLLVLDNVWNDAIFAYLGARLPLLVSSRNIPSNCAFALDVDLSGGLEEEQSLQLFAAALRRPVHALPPEVPPLVAACAGLPLAVALTAQLVAQERSDIAGACRRLRDVIADRLRQLPVSSYYCGNSDADWTLFSIVGLSLEALRRDRSAWFDAFSFFAALEADAWVPEAVLLPFWPVQDAAMARDLVVEELVDKSLLLMYEGEQQEVLFAVHSIVLAVLCESLRPDEIAEKHRQLVGGWREACGGRWGDLSAGYVLRHLCGHLRSAGQEAEAAAALRDFRFVSRRLQAEGGAAVAADAAGHEDPVLRSLTALLRAPRCAAKSGRYRAELRQVCALLPSGDVLRSWAEEEAEGGLWATGGGRGAAAAGWEAIEHRDHQCVAALAAADGCPGVLVAVKRSEVLVLEADELRVVARFQLESPEASEGAALTNGGRTLLLTTRSGALFACSFASPLRELARLHRAAPQRGGERLAVQRVATEDPVLLLAGGGCSLLAVSHRGRLTLQRLEGPPYALRTSPGHHLQLDWMAGPLPASRTEIAVAQTVLQRFKAGFEAMTSSPELLGLRETFAESKVGLVVSPCGRFVAAFRKKCIAVVRVQDASLELLYEAERPKSIGCVCFMTLPKADSPAETVIVEAVGGCVVIRRVCERDSILHKVEFWSDAAALASHGTLLFVYSGQDFSMWSVSLEASPQRSGVTKFPGGCACLLHAGFPTFISGVEGALVRLRQRDAFGELQELCSSDLQAEVLASQTDLFLVEDVRQHGVRVTNLRTKELLLDGLLPKFGASMVVHGLSAEKLATAWSTGCGVHVFDVGSGARTPLPVQTFKMCTAIRPCFEDCLFVGFNDGSVALQRSDSAELVEISGPEPYFVKYLLPVSARHELASVSFGSSGCRVRVWSNIGPEGPVCATSVDLSWKIPLMSALPMTITMFTVTHTASPTISPNGRYMALVLPSDPPTDPSLLAVIDLESGRFRKETLAACGSVQLVEQGGATWLFAALHREVVSARVDGAGFFDGAEASFTDTALRLDEKLKRLTACAPTEMIVTSADAVTIWDLGAEGRLRNGRLLVPRSVVTGDFEATYVQGATLVIVTLFQKSDMNYCNNFYVFHRS